MKSMQAKIGVISYYGPRPGLALKVVAGIVSPEKVHETREWRSASDVRFDAGIASQVGSYFRVHGIKQVNFVDAVTDCAHDDRNICGCDDSVFKTSGADPMYIKDGLPGEPEDQILIAAARNGAYVHVSSHLDFHAARDAQAKGRTFYFSDEGENKVRETAANYAGTNGSTRLWLQRAYQRTSEHNVAASMFAADKTQDEVEDIAADIAELFLDKKLVTVDGELWREGKGAKVGVAISVIPGGVVHLGITPMNKFPEFCDRWMKAINAAGHGVESWRPLFELTRVATVDRRAA
jgi:hypothetical protein